MTGGPPGASTPPPAAAAVPLLAGNPRVALLDYDHVPGTATGTAAPGSLLLVHGFGDDKTTLRPLGAALCPPGAVAVHPTLRAHGASPAPAWGYSPLDLAADLHRIADSFPRPVHVIGHSYGALVAAVAALALGPDRVASVAVLDQSFEAWPDRYVDDEWSEASHLKWHYDHTHVLTALAALDIPVLSVIARDSNVVPHAERMRMISRCGGQFTCVITGGTHTGFLRDNAISVLADFYERKFSGNGQGVRT